MVRDRATFWSALAEEDGRAWSVAVPEGPVPVRATVEELEAALDALLGNVHGHSRT